MNEIKTYLIVGATWMAKVELDSKLISDMGLYKTDKEIEDALIVEASTRAIENKLKRKSDLSIEYFNEYNENPLKNLENTIHQLMYGLITEELEPGCGIGAMLCIFDMDVFIKNKEDGISFISNEVILRNVGSPHLINAFLKKYPTTNENKIK